MPTFIGPPLESEVGLGPLTMGGFLEEVALRYASREATCFHGATGVARSTYTELHHEARRIARALIAVGVGKGTRVALLMGNRPEWLHAAFGVALAGGVLIPLNTMFEPPEITYVLRHCDAAVVLHQARLARHDYAAQLEEVETELPNLAHRFCLGTTDYDEFLAGGERVSDVTLDGRAEEVSPHDDALIIYTSGTTGRPKGVVHGHRAAAIQCWRFAQQLCLDPSVRVWSAFPFFWTAGFCMVMGATLAAGGCLVLQELFEPGEALRLLQDERVTTPHAWPHQAAAIEAYPDWERFDLSNVKHVDESNALTRHPTVSLSEPWSPRAAYGLTETFTIISSVPANTPTAERLHHEGRVLPGNILRIVDAHSGEEQGIGAAGEIRVKGPTLMKGYLKVADEDVFDVEGFFPTGDAGFVDESGRLHWLGRTNDLIKTGGANVSPVEIENELLYHPGLQSARALGLPHPTLGQVVVVCAVKQANVEVSEDDVRDFLRGKLASYKLPKFVLFFDENELGLTGNAKIRVDDLRGLAQKRLEPVESG